MVVASFSIAKTRSQRPERASAMAFPPTPANASIITVADLGADSAMWAAILLDGVSWNSRLHGEMAWFVLCDGFGSDAEP